MSGAVFGLVCGTQRSAKGQEVFDKVCQHLTLANNEKEYFACSFRDEKKTRVSSCSRNYLVVVVIVYLVVVVVVAIVVVVAASFC